MKTLLDLSPAELKHAASLKEQIDALQKQLSALLGSPAPAAKPAAPAKKRTISAAGLARIKAAQKARWAKVKQGAAKAAAKPVATLPAKKKFTMSAAAKAKISAAAKARWAKIKAQKKA